MGFWSFDTRKRGGGLKLYLYISSNNDLNLLIVFQWRWCIISIAKRGSWYFYYVFKYNCTIMICTLNSRIICYSYVPFFVEFGPTFSANHALFFNILYPTGPQIVPVPFISISNQSSTFSVSLTRFFSIKPTPDTFVSHAVSCSV